MRAFSCPARCFSWPIWRLPSGPLVANASTGSPPWSPRLAAGLSISRRKGPCSGGRFAVTGPASRTRPGAALPSAPGARSPVRSRMARTAIGVPSGSASSSRSPACARSGTASDGKSNVTAAGNGVPSASSHRSATAATSACVMKPVSGASAPVSSSSRSPSWVALRVAVGSKLSSAGDTVSASAVTFWSSREATRGRADRGGLRLTAIGTRRASPETTAMCRRARGHLPPGWLREGASGTPWRFQSLAGPVRPVLGAGKRQGVPPESCGAHWRRYGATRGRARAA